MKRLAGCCLLKCRALAQNLICFFGRLRAPAKLQIGIPSMTIQSRLPETKDELPKEILDLGHILGTLPATYQKEVAPVFQKLADSMQRRRRILSLVQEALSQLRLDIKYLMFDLEVTKEERNELRRQLEEREKF